jgi:toxin ParE1/3/4
MPLRQVEFHPEAVEEAEAAARWYRERSTAVADAFLSELERSMELIEESPDRWPPTIQGTRRFLMRRFPFSVVYRHSAEAIEVLAVAHAR